MSLDILTNTITNSADCRSDYKIYNSIYEELNEICNIIDEELGFFKPYKITHKIIHTHLSDIIDRYFHRIETSLPICITNPLTGFYMTGTYSLIGSYTSAETDD